MDVDALSVLQVVVAVPMPRDVGLRLDDLRPPLGATPRRVEGRVARMVQEDLQGEQLERCLGRGVGPHEEGAPRRILALLARLARREDRRAIGHEPRRITHAQRLVEDAGRVVDAAADDDAPGALVDRELLALFTLVLLPFLALLAPLALLALLSLLSLLAILLLTLVTLVAALRLDLVLVLVIFLTLLFRLLPGSRLPCHPSHESR